jgi:two-component system response regulator HydG
MREAIAKVRQVAPTDATVLIYGETGTGKELVARALHDASPRRHRPFVALNCAALSEGIIESELFGHQRGSFTGAVADRTGRIEYANHGTLFLDEVADMPTSTQVKLLRVLEQGEITPIGSNKIVRVDVRVVAATHRRLDGEVQAGKFRSDLYYRLKVVTVELPPLRERREDIPLLATDFLAKAAERHGRSVPQLTPAVFEALSRYEWPGNVRELKNVIENIVVTTQTPVTDLRDLPENLQPAPVTSIVPVSTSVPQTMESAEIIAIRNALMTTGGKREEAAKLLGIGERTLYRKIRKYNL